MGLVLAPFSAALEARDPDLRGHSASAGSQFDPDLAETFVGGWRSGDIVVGELLLDVAT